MTHTESLLLSESIIHPMCLQWLYESVYVSNGLYVSLGCGADEGFIIDIVRI
jgi:hypothetical protein